MTPPVQTQLTEEQELDDAEFLRWVAGWLDRIDPILQAVFSREDTVPDEDERRRMVEFLQGTSAQDRLRALADAYLAQQRVIEAARLVADWGDGPREDDPPETIGVWHEDLARLRAAVSVGSPETRTE